MPRTAVAGNLNSTALFGSARSNWVMTQGATLACNPHWPFADAHKLAKTTVQKFSKTIDVGAYTTAF